MYSPPLDNLRNASVGARSCWQLTLALLVCACAVQSAPEPIASSAKPQTNAASDAHDIARTIQLEDGTYIEVKRGTDPGFTHCCGDTEYKMEMDCSERLMRCYETKGSGWKQTYGKHCKRELQQECYLQACTRICEAIESVGGQL